MANIIVYGIVTATVGVTGSETKLSERSFETVIAGAINSPCESALSLTTAYPGGLSTVHAKLYNKIKYVITPFNRSIDNTVTIIADVKFYDVN